MERLLTFVEARRAVEERAAEVPAPSTETVVLTSAGGRVLAEDLCADRDFPPFARVARDGYAVRHEDVRRVPAVLRLVGEVKAGGGFSGKLASGECVEIMTGAALPKGADAVVMVEYTEQAAGGVRVLRGVEAGENFVAQGSEASAGTVVLRRGQRMDAAAVAMAASVGRREVVVFRKPRVAIIATGDELVELDARPGPAEIRNSNSYSLTAQVAQYGGEAVILPIARDSLNDLRERIAAARACDLVLLTGGVSMGKYDLVEQALEEFGAEFVFTGARVQPGKPVVFGTFAGDGAGEGARYFFGLPGNPVSTMVCLLVFVRPMLDALGGAAVRPLRFLSARLGREITVKTGLTRFLPAAFSGEFDNVQVELLRWHGSGDVAATSQADCFVVVPPDRERIEAGEMVSVLLA